MLSMVIGLVLLGSCKRENWLPAGHPVTPYSLQVPAGFPPPYLPIQNPLTVEGIELGHRLYYDSILSSNGLSCASCHKPALSFSSPYYSNGGGEKISIPAHVNLAWTNGYLWDGSAPTLPDVCMADFGPDFFNTNMSDLVQKLIKHEQYPILFKKAFNVDDISKLSSADLQQKIVYSISQFMLTMVSNQSKCDKVYRREAMFTPEEMDGFQTFTTERGDCFHCHDYPLFTSNTFNNTGLDSFLLGNNLGRYRVTHDPNDKGKFNVPTLRNIELTAPYMHDARFATLEEVVEYYNSGVHFNSPNIDPLMTKPAKIYGLHLTQTQKANLVKFLKTLTDTTFINNTSFRNPL